jgi:hypothetical protein
VSVLLLVRSSEGVVTPPAAGFVVVARNTPEVSFEIDFTNEPTSTIRTWTSLSDRLREIHLRVYRTTELDEFQIGTLTVVLDNNDRAVEPNFAASPYFPNVVPRRPVRYQARWSGVDYPRFLGFIRAFGTEWPGQRDSVVVIEAADYGFVLNRATVTLNGYPEETVKQRINRVLDAIGVLLGDREIDNSSTVVAAVPEAEEGQEPTVVGALGHCQDCARSEGGYLFVTRTGRVAFHNSYHRRDVLGSPAVSFGDDPTNTAEQPYSPDLLGQLSDSQLWNEAAVLTAAGERESHSDAASVARFWPSRRDEFRSVLARPGDAFALASTFVWRYKEPRVRYPRLTVPMLDRAAMNMPALLGAEVGTRCQVLRRPPGGGAVIDEEVHVEGISDDVKVQGAVWNLGFDVSPADAALDVFQLGTDALDADKVVGY